MSAVAAPLAVRRTRRAEGSRVFSPPLPRPLSARPQPSTSFCPRGTQRYPRPDVGKRSSDAPAGVDTDLGARAWPWQLATW